MSNQPAGTSIVSAYLVYNPGLTTLSQCPGTGFTLLTDTGTATNAWKSLPIDILDGKQHSLLAVRIAGQTTGFDVYADGSLVFTAVDKSNTLTDTGLLGARTDNSVVNFFYSVGTPVSSTDFALVATQPTTNTIGQSATTTVGITAFNGFSGNVALTDSSPSGLSCGSPSSTTIAGSETASITCSTSNAGIYTLTIRGSSGSLVRSTTATFSFSDFAVSASPATLSMNPGGQAISTISLNLLNGFSSTVTLAISNPAGTSASLSQTNISAMGSSTLTITSTTPGSYNVVITGTSGTLTRTITVKVTVGTVSTSVAIDAPSTLTVVQTKTASFAVTATDVVQTPTLTLSVDQLPSNATFTTIQGSSPLSETFTWATTTANSPGTYSVGFSATDGGSSAQIYVVITLVSSDVLPLVIVPHAQNATVGTDLQFTVSGNDPARTGDPLILSATGLAANMIFNESTGAFSFTPSPSQAHQTFVVNFTATNSNNPSWTKTEPVSIYVQEAASRSSTGGICLSCLLPSGLTTTAWLLAIGSLIGIASSITILHVRASAELAAAKSRMRSLNTQSGRSRPSRYQPDRRIVVQARRRPKKTGSGLYITRR
jgi:hypothetical protein